MKLDVLVLEKTGVLKTGPAGRTVTRSSNQFQIVLNPIFRLNRQTRLKSVKLAKADDSVRYLNPVF